MSEKQKNTAGIQEAYEHWQNRSDSRSLQIWKIKDDNDNWVIAPNKCKGAVAHKVEKR